MERHDYFTHFEQSRTLYVGPNQDITSSILLPITLLPLNHCHI